MNDDMRNENNSSIWQTTMGLYRSSEDKLYENRSGEQGNSGTYSEPVFVKRESGEYYGSSSGGGYQTPEESGGNGRGGKGKKLIAAVLAFALSFTAGGAGGYIAASNIDRGSDSSISLNVDPTHTYDIAEAIATKVMPSVVGISTKTEVTYSTWFGMPQTGVSEGVGTGIIVDRSGYILTNSHVVSDGRAQEIKVDLYDGRTVEGKVLWNDQSIDLALVKIEANDLTAAELGDSDEVNIGAYALAIGNPMGMAFERSVTQGIISGLNRSIQVTDQSTGSTVNMDGLIQTDASINSGNSGGPLINSYGQVVGINSAKAQSAEGLGFAIPVNTAKPIIAEVMEKGEFSKAYIGIGGVDVETVISESNLEDLGTKTGVYVVQIYTNSPAAQAGLVEGDIITAINEKEVEGMTELQAKLFQYRPGDQVSLTILRNKQKMNVSVTLAQQQDAPAYTYNN